MFSIKITARLNGKMKMAEDNKDTNVSDLLFTRSEENTLAAQRYSIVRKVGEGSYAKVILCKKVTEGQTNYSACKIMDTETAPPEFVKTFLPREIDILLKIKHHYIIHVESIFKRRAKYYILMRYAENRDLLEYIIEHASVSETRARYWMTQLFHALRYLHDDENIVHRDIKCENILLTERFNVRLCDFGFSRQVKNNEMSRTFCGSRAYTAPEVLRGKAYNPKKYDIWSSGVVLMVMLNKKFPFSEPNNKKLYQKMMSRNWIFRPKIEETLTTQIKEALQNMLEPEQKKRWTALQCLQSEWVNMDERLTKLNPLIITGAVQTEKSALKTSSMAKAGDIIDENRSGVTVLRRSDKAPRESMFGASLIGEAVKGGVKQNRAELKGGSVKAVNYEEVTADEQPEI